MTVHDALTRLQKKFPLKDRQDRLDSDLKQLHITVLNSFYEQGRPLSNKQIQARFPYIDPHEALTKLSDHDLIVLDNAGDKILGAYPFTLERTVHNIHINQHELHAMCALDVLAIAPMFNAPACIDSRCYLSEASIKIKMDGIKIVDVQPSGDVYVGVHWQTPVGHAAYSLCMDMVFLQDRNTALTWQDARTHHGTSLFKLEDAARLGAAFFTPLLQ
jgi:mercuric reductase